MISIARIRFDDGGCIIYFDRDQYESGLMTIKIKGTDPLFLYSEKLYKDSYKIELNENHLGKKMIVDLLSEVDGERYQRAIRIPLNLILLKQEEDNNEEEQISQPTEPVVEDIPLPIDDFVIDTTELESLASRYYRR